MREFRLAGTFILALLSAGCSTTTAEQDEDVVQVNDPLEGMNRFFFDLNQRFDRNAGRPAATAYKDTVPQTVRGSLHNVLDNLGGPVTVANNLLQVRLADAGVAAGRAGRFGLVVGVDRVGQSDDLRRNGADVVVTDLAELLAT